MSGYSHKIYEPKQTSSEVVLDDDEYIVALVGRAGLFIDKFGIKTNKGREWGFGGEGGGPFNVDVPAGYYVSDFGSNTWEHLSCIMADIKQIPGTGATTSKTYDRFFKSPNFAKLFLTIMQFLTTQDCCKVFKVGRQLAQLRFMPEFLDRQIMLCVKHTNENIRKYLSKLLKHSRKLEAYKFGKRFLMDNKNKIDNGEGKDMSGWQIIEDGGDGIKAKGNAFATSHGWCTVMQEKSFEDIFNEELLEQIYIGEIIISAGAIFKDSGFGGVGKVKLEIVGDNGQIIYSNEDSKKSDQAGTNISTSYVRDIKNLVNPKKFRLYVGGKDTCNWAGYYGPDINGIFLKAWPNIKQV